MEHLETCCRYTSDFHLNQNFIFRCTNKKVCVSPGKFYDAFCQIEIMGVVWIQPKIIE